MTTIACYATFKDHCTSSGGKVVSTIYLVSDSQFTTIGNKTILKKEKNRQKVFKVGESNLLLGFFNEAQFGDKMLCNLISRVSYNPKIRFPKKPDDVIKGLMHEINSYIQSDATPRSADLCIICVYIYKNQFFVKLITLKNNESKCSIKSIPVTNSLVVFIEGSGSENLKETFKSLKSKNPEVNESAVFFRSFIEHLKSNTDELSSLPLQGALINSEGNVKYLSIKIDDKFYLNGMEHYNRMELKYEIDFRDEYFEFLHPDGRIKGRNRKKII